MLFINLRKKQGSFWITIFLLQNHQSRNYNTWLVCFNIIYNNIIVTSGKHARANVIVVSYYTTIVAGRSCVSTSPSPMSIVLRRAVVSSVSCSSVVCACSRFAGRSTTANYFSVEWLDIKT